MSGPFGSSSYGYNGLGDRLTQNGVNYTLDLNAGLTQVLNDGTNQYLYGAGRIAQVNTETEYFLGDALGSVRQLTDSQGNITLANAYQPYGDLAQTTGSAQTSYGFTGEFTDPSGMMYLRARYYSPNDGRFLTQDTWMGDENAPMSFNLWNYVQSNPVNYIDSTGRARSGCNSIDERVATAERYISKTDHRGNTIQDPINTYTAAGIAVQCFGGDISRDADNSGLGIAQISNNQVQTAYGEIIGDRKDSRYGLRCYILKQAIRSVDNIVPCFCETRDQLERGLVGDQKFDDIYTLEAIHDQKNPSWAVVYMRRRIEMVIKECKGKNVKCTDTDIFIIAAMAQNGSGFAKNEMIRIRNNFVDPTLRINWERYFTDRQSNSDQSWWQNRQTGNRDYDTKYMLDLFYTFALRLEKDGYFLPEIDDARILKLMY